MRRRLAIALATAALLYDLYRPGRRWLARKLGQWAWKVGANA